MSIRMGKVLPSIIGVDQTCSVFGHSISDNCHLLWNVVDYIDSKPLMGAALIKIDSSKAFYRVSHKYIFPVSTFTDRVKGVRRRAPEYVPGEADDTEMEEESSVNANAAPKTCPPVAPKTAGDEGKKEREA